MKEKQVEEGEKKQSIQGWASSAVLSVIVLYGLIIPMLAFSQLHVRDAQRLMTSIPVRVQAVHIMYMYSWWLCVFFPKLESKHIPS